MPRNTGLARPCPTTRRSNACKKILLVVVKNVVMLDHTTAAPGTLVLRQRCLGFLRSFLQEVYIPQSLLDEDIGVNKILSAPPQIDLAFNRVFWKLLAKFLCYKQRANFLDWEERRQVLTALAVFHMTKNIFSRTTRTHVDPFINKECRSLTCLEAANTPCAKPIPTFKNVKTLITQGIFGTC